MKGSYSDWQLKRDRWLLNAACCAMILSGVWLFSSRFLVGVSVLEYSNESVVSVTFLDGQFYKQWVSPESGAWIDESWRSSFVVALGTAVTAGFVWWGAKVHWDFDHRLPSEATEKQ